MGAIHPTDFIIYDFNLELLKAKVIYVNYGNVFT